MCERETYGAGGEWGGGDVGGRGVTGPDKGDNKSEGSDDDPQPRGHALRAGGQVTGAERCDGDEMTGGDKAQHKGVVPALLFISCHMSSGLSDACRQLLEGCELGFTTAPAWNSASLGALGDRNPSQLPTSNR